MTIFIKKLARLWNYLTSTYPPRILKISLSVIAVTLVASLVSAIIQSANPVEQQGFVKLLWDNIIDIGGWYLLPLAVLIAIPAYRFTILAIRKVSSESKAMTPFQRYSLLLYAVIAIALIVLIANLFY